MNNEKVIRKVLTNQHGGLNISHRSPGHTYHSDTASINREVIAMLYEKLRTIVAEQFSLSEDSVTMYTSFVDDLGADSLDAVELIMALEEEFDIPEVDEETVAEFHTVGDVFRFISLNCD